MYCHSKRLCYELYWDPPKREGSKGKIGGLSVKQKVYLLRGFLLGIKDSRLIAFPLRNCSTQSDSYGFYSALSPCGLPVVSGQNVYVLGHKELGH